MSNTLHAYFSGGILYVEHYTHFIDWCVMKIKRRRLRYRVSPSDAFAVSNQQGTITVYRNGKEVKPIYDYD